MRSKALVLDFGGPVLKSPFELLRDGERRARLEPGALDWAGPFAPGSDADWRAQQSGEITERTYWQRKADRFAELTGNPATIETLMGVLFDAPEDELVRPEAHELAAAAKRAGHLLAVCTNDLRAFHDARWIARIGFLDAVDVLVDGSVEQVLKPDPRIFALVTDRLGVDATECLFVDDQPVNVAGARAVGMQAVGFDVTDPARSYAAVRALLDLR